MQEELPLITLRLNEKTSYDYIFIDKDQRLHILMPISSGQDVGLDNTCQATTEIKNFFGLTHDDKSRSIITVISTYINDLNKDIELIEKYELQKSEMYVQKKKRLAQLIQYSTFVFELVTDQNAVNLIQSTYSVSSFPPGVKRALEQATNCFSVQLNPDYKDEFLRFGPSLFTVERPNGSNMSKYSNSFTKKLSDMLSLISQEQFVKFQKLRQSHGIAKFIELFSQEFEVLDKPSIKSSIDWANLEAMQKESLENQLKRLKKALKLKLIEEDLLNADKIEFKYKSLEDGSEKKIDLDYLLGVFGDLEFSDICNALLPEAYKEQLKEKFTESPFDTLKELLDTTNVKLTKARLSIMVQFFIGVANGYHYEHIDPNNKRNFAEILDKHADELLKLIHSTLNSENSFEEVLLSFLNRHLGKCSFNNEHQVAIKKRFKDQFFMISASPHFDEFLFLLPNKEGSFFSHQNRISLLFSEYCKYAAPQKYSDFYKTEKFPEHVSCENENKFSAILENTNPIGTREIKVRGYPSELPDNDLIAYLRDHFQNLDVIEGEAKKIQSIIDQKPKIVKAVLIQLSTKEKKEEFCKKWNVPNIMYLTVEMEQALFALYSLTHSRTDIAKLSRKARVINMLTALGIDKKHISISVHQDDALIIEFKAIHKGQEDKEKNDANRDIIEYSVEHSRKFVHISRNMLDNLRKHNLISGFIPYDTENTVYTNQQSEIVSILKRLYPLATIVTEEDKKEHVLFAGATYQPKENEIFVGYNHSNGFIVRGDKNILKHLQEFQMNACESLFVMSDIDALLQKESSDKTASSITSLELKSFLESKNINCHYIRPGEGGWIISLESYEKDKLLLLKGAQESLKPEEEALPFQANQFISFASDKPNNKDSLVDYFSKEENKNKLIICPSAGVKGAFTAFVYGNAKPFWKGYRFRLTLNGPELTIDKKQLEDKSNLIKLDVNTDIINFYGKEILAKLTQLKSAQGKEVVRCISEKTKTIVQPMCYVDVEAKETEVEIEVYRYEPIGKLEDLVARLEHQTKDDFLEMRSSKSPETSNVMEVQSVFPCFNFTGQFFHTNTCAKLEETVGDFEQKIENSNL